MITGLKTDNKDEVYSAQFEMEPVVENNKGSVELKHG